MSFAKKDIFQGEVILLIHLNKYFWGLLFVSLGLVSCTSESKAKNQALEMAKTEYENKMRKDINAKFTENHVLYQDYLMFLFKRTTYEVEDVIKSSDSQYLVAIQITTLRESFRSDLENIIQNLKPHQFTKFNFGEALALIKAQKGGEDFQINKVKVPIHIE